MEFNIKNFLSILLYLLAHLIRMNLADDEMKYNIIYDRTETFNGTDTYFTYKLDIVKKDETKNIFVVDGTVGLKQELNDDWKMAIELFKLNENNEYESIFGIPKVGVCQYMKTSYKKYFYDDISTYSNLPHYDTCPVPAAQYEIKQYPFDMETFKKFNHLISPGKYRLQTFLVQNDVSVSGVLFYGEVTEKS